MPYCADTARTARQPRSLGDAARLRLRFHLRAQVAALWLITVLALSLALSPLVSRMHQVTHPGHGQVAATTLPVSATVAQADGSASSDSWPLERLFGQHTEGSQVCQLLDHAQTSDAPPALAFAVLLLVPAQALRSPCVAASATATLAYFQARGPPAFL